MSLAFFGWGLGFTVLGFGGSYVPRHAPIAADGSAGALVTCWLLTENSSLSVSGSSKGSLYLKNPVRSTLSGVPSKGSCLGLAG